MLAEPQTSTLCALDAVIFADCGECRKYDGRRSCGGYGSCSGGERLRVVPAAHPACGCFDRLEESVPE
jgi:hypothetical protein